MITLFLAAATLAAQAEATVAAAPLLPPETVRERAARESATTAALVGFVIAVDSVTTYRSTRAGLGELVSDSVEVRVGLRTAGLAAVVAADYQLRATGHRREANWLRWGAFGIGMVVAGRNVVLERSR